MTVSKAFEPLSIGVDIGGTSTKFGVVDKNGNLLFSDTEPTQIHTEIETFIDAIYEKLISFIERSGGIGRVKGMGVGIPNGNYYTGIIEYAPNLPWKGIIPVAKLFSNKFQMPVILTNDANAAAIGEMKYGAAKGMRDFIMVTLGTGVGSGFVSNGQLIYGHDGFAGELGHTIVIPGGRVHPGTGKKGPLEMYASATGVKMNALEILQNSSIPSLLRSVPAEEMNSKKVYEAAIQGDELALEIFEFTGRILGIALANSIMISSPEAIVLFGGLTKAGDYLLKPTKHHMEDNLLKVFQNKVKLLLSHLSEADAAILGASALVWD